MIAILGGVRCNLIVVLICASLVMLIIFSSVCLCLLWGNVQVPLPSLLPVFELGCFVEQHILDVNPSLAV